MRPLFLSLVCLALVLATTPSAHAAECDDVKPEHAAEAWGVVLDGTLALLSEVGLQIGLAEGDPDQPLVLGSMYNAEGAVQPKRVPAWWLPEVDDEVLVVFEHGDAAPADDDDPRAREKQAFQMISNVLKYHAELEMELTVVRDLAGQQDSTLDFAKELDQMIECLEMLSEISKKASHTGQSVVGNIRG